MKKNKDNEYNNDLNLLKMKMYNYKEMLKLFALNFRSEKFTATRNSVYAFLIGPSAVVLAFNVFNPFSIFRNIAVYSAFGGSIICFMFSLQDDLSHIAQQDRTPLGDMARYRFQQLAAYDGLVLSYREQTKKFASGEKRL